MVLKMLLGMKQVGTQEGLPSKHRFLGYKLHSLVRESQQEGTDSSGILPVPQYWPYYEAKPFNPCGDLPVTVTKPSTADKLCNRQ